MINFGLFFSTLAYDTVERERSVQTRKETNKRKRPNALVALALSVHAPREIQISSSTKIRY